MKTLLFAAVLVLSSLAAAQQQQPFDTLIRNGRVVDGSGNPWIYADVGIVGDRIAFVGHAAPDVKAKRTIDATGLIIAPGFIDMLGQSELTLLIDKQAVSKLTQGITTEITGEGESVAPQNDATIAAQKDFLDHYHLTIDWQSLDEYFRRLEKQGSGINLGTYVGAAQLRRIAVGTENRPATAAELKQMEEMVDDAMNDGALGVSSALIYAPGNYASTEELIALAKVAARSGGIYASHIRNEGDSEMQALDEAFRIGREANIPVEIFHFKAAGKENWGKMPQAIAAVEKARAEGIDVNADQYPYIASATSLGAVIPPQYHAGGTVGHRWADARLVLDRCLRRPAERCRHARADPQRAGSAARGHYGKYVARHRRPRGHSDRFRTESRAEKIRRQELGADRASGKQGSL